MRSTRPASARSTAHAGACTVFALVVATALGGCQGGFVDQRYDRVTDSFIVTLGPLGLEGSLFGELHLIATIPGHFSPERPASEVHAVFKFISFRTITLRADDHVIQKPRRLFEDYGVLFSAEEFRQIASARRLAGRFDVEDAEFTFDAEQLALLREFAVRIRLLPDPASAESAFPDGPARDDRAGVERAVGGALRPERGVDAQATRIHEIQGRSHRSPLAGTAVAGVEGVVTRVEERGFTIEDSQPDDDDATSEGILVFTRDAPGVRVGDRVRVAGKVEEFYPGGADTGNLSTTEITTPRVEVLERGVALPAAVRLGDGGRRLPRKSICDDAVAGDVEDPGTPFDPADDAIDCFESLEGMRVVIEDALVVGPTSEHHEVWVIADGGSGIEHRSARGGILLRPDDVRPERVQIQFERGAVPVLAVGARIARLEGVVAYAFGSYEVRVDAVPAVVAGELDPEATRLRSTDEGLTLATYNVLNLHPGSGARIARIARQIVDGLAAPDIVALEEIQDASGPKDDGAVSAERTFAALIDAILVAGGPQYEFRQVDPVDGADGGQPGGNIRVGFLFRPARVAFVDRAPAAGAGESVLASPVRLGEGVDAFAGSRKSLHGEFLFRGHRLHVIANHLSSKFGSSPAWGRRQPPIDGGAAKRVAQAEHIGSVARKLASGATRSPVVVLGDLNDFEWSDSLRALAGAGGELVALVETLPASERYTYVFQGCSQVLDHVLVSRDLAPGAEIDIVHLNSEFPEPASDHDPVVVRLAFGR